MHKKTNIPRLLNFLSITKLLKRKNFGKNTFVGYRITRNHLINYIKIKYHTTDYDITTIDKAFVYEFFAYLQGFNRKDNKKLCTTNGALKHITRFKKVMNGGHGQRMDQH